MHRDKDAYPGEDGDTNRPEKHVHADERRPDPAQTHRRITDKGHRNHPE